ncbi:hypothetical protein [Halogeometricum luteum]|uniref:Uncharacterized protein n=1 Tax=Halogeometricum luteum TaxID=2950537 RepID=A0ABU2G7H8_9EURY|nr:hypothetical protein [Halogeometricum sp. S3BR5-2]MDS0296254.1 hypothetical protein [Halogeometricum sp. S3BR5-2]
MTSDARRTRGDAWAWALLSLFGFSAGGEATDGGGDDSADGEESDTDLDTGTDTDAR